MAGATFEDGSLDLYLSTDTDFDASGVSMFRIVAAPGANSSCYRVLVYQGEHMVAWY